MHSLLVSASPWIRVILIASVLPRVMVSAAQCFVSTTELYDAVSTYLEDSSSSSAVAQTYGWPINSWCVSQISDFSKVFSDPAARFFDESLNQWDLSAAVDTTSMFAGAASFRGDGLSEWNVSSVRQMGYMFARASAFQADLSRWDVRSVKVLANTFFQATSFDSDISQWDVRNVENMDSMVAGAESFSQNLCVWGSKLSDNVVVDSPFGEQYTVFRGTSCPSFDSPNMTAVPPGPICSDCSSAFIRKLRFAFSVSLLVTLVSAV